MSTTSPRARRSTQPIPRVQYPTAGGSLAWTADGKGFWYTRYPGAESAGSRPAFLHAGLFPPLGAIRQHDPLVLGAKDGLERVSEIFLDNRTAAPRCWRRCSAATAANARLCAAPDGSAAAGRTL